MSRLVACLLLSSMVALAAPQRFRVLFGGADETPADWSGSVGARGGQARILAMHHFAPTDSFEPSSWKADNKMDDDINLLPQESAVFPKTKWKGFLVDVDGPDSTMLTLRTAQGEAEVRTGAVRYMAQAKLLGGRLIVERVPAAAAMAGPETDDDYPAVTVGPDGRVWSAWISYQDGQERVLLRYSDDGESWSAAEALSPAAGDYYQVELLSTAPRTLLAVWSATVNGNVDLFERRFENGAWSAVERITSEPGPDTFPKLAAGADGEVFLAWQSSGKLRTDVSLKVRRNGRWSEAMKVTEHPASDWEPALAVNSRGEAAVAWDSYRHGNYDIFLRRYRNGKLGPVERITNSPDAEQHAALAYDQRDRLWIAYDNSGPDWGKDTHGIAGILRAEGGLYAQRRVEVRVLDRAVWCSRRGRLTKSCPASPCSAAA